LLRVLWNIQEKIERYDLYWKRLVSVNEKGGIICGLRYNKCIFLKVVLFEDSKYKQKYEYWNSIRNIWKRSSLTVICQAYPSGKYIPIVILSYQYLIYKPTFLTTCSHSNNAIVQRFCFLWWEYFFLTQSLMAKSSLLSVSHYWNLCSE